MTRASPRGRRIVVTSATLLFDQFTDTRAAGAVNGTPATPGPGTRTVVDTNSKISVGSGVVSFATGGVVAGDPGLWYASVVRQAGRALLGQINVNPSQIMSFGWDADQAGNISDSVLFYSGSVLYIRNNLASLVVGVYTAGTTYDLCLTMRAAGMFYFIKGGAFTVWTLIWCSTLLSSNMFPGVVAGDTLVVFTVDYIRVPSSLWLPTPIACDAFTRADGALGNSDVVGPDAQGVSARAWTGATWTIATNKAVNTPTLGAELVTNGDMELDSNWSNSGTPTTNERSTEQIHGGTYSRKAIGDGASDGITNNNITSCADGTWLVLTAWVYPVDVRVEIAAQNDISLTVFTPVATFGAWLNILAIGRVALVSSWNALVLARTLGAAGTFYLDDVSLKALSLPTLFSSLTDSATSDVHVDATVAALTAGTQAGVVFNLDDAANPQNFRIAYFDGAGNVKCDECVAGAYTALGTAVKAFTAGDTLRPAVTGTALRLYHITAAGVATLILATTMTANTNKLHGLFSTYSANTFSAFTVFPTGTGNEYSALDSF